MNDALTFPVNDVLSFSSCHQLDYHIAQIFGEGKPWRIWKIIGGSPNFTIQI